MKARVPDYRVRYSPKAKNLRLKITREEGLSVIVPRNFDEKRIPALLKKKKTWIADAMKRIGETRRFLEQDAEKHFPEVIGLAAIGETWTVEYREDGTRSGTLLKAEEEKLVVISADFNRKDVIRKLKIWLRTKVRESLFPIAENIAAKRRLNFEGLMVKSQRTRWASCSARKNLALNTKLLFLEPDLVRYVLIHELCHTVQMNHSKEFWQILASHEPNYLPLDRALRNAWKTLPQWVF